MAVVSAPCVFSELKPVPGKPEEFIIEVPSGTNPEDSYVINLQVVPDGTIAPYWCGCRGFMFRRYCRHMTALKEQIASGEYVLPL